MSGAGHSYEGVVDPEPRWSRWSPLVGLVLTVLLVAVPSLPGRINNDVISMLTEIDERSISNWHSPLLQYIWMPFRELGLGLGPVLIAQVIGAYVAVWFVLETYGFSRRSSSMLALGVCVHPVTYGLLTATFRDSWFLVCWLFALALARTDRVTGRRRIALVFVACFFAYASRQNGIAIVPVAIFAATADSTWMPKISCSWWRRAGTAFVGTVVVVAAMAGLLSLLPVEKRHPGAVYPWDLVRFSLRADEVLLPPELNPHDLTISELSELATPYNLDRVMFERQAVPFMLDGERLTAAEDAWVDLVRADPLEYLRMRWQLMSHQIGLGGNTRNPFLPEAIPNSLGIEPWFPDLADRATDYQLTFNGGPRWWDAGAVHRAWPMLVLLAVAALLDLLRRRGTRISVDAALGSGAYLITVMFFATQLHFRFVSPVIVVAVVASLGMFRPWRPAPSASLLSIGDGAKMEASEGFRDQPVEKELASEERRDDSGVGETTSADQLEDGDRDADREKHASGNDEESHWAEHERDADDDPEEAEEVSDRPDVARAFSLEVVDRHESNVDP
jgi:hypothetical protein